MPGRRHQIRHDSQARRLKREQARREEIYQFAILGFSLVAWRISTRRRARIKFWLAAEGIVLGPSSMGKASAVRIRFRTPDRTSDKVQLICNPKNPAEAELLREGLPITRWLPGIFLLVAAIMLIKILGAMGPDV